MWNVGVEGDDIHSNQEYISSGRSLPVVFLDSLWCLVSKMVSSLHGASSDSNKLGFFFLLKFFLNQEIKTQCASAARE